MAGDKRILIDVLLESASRECAASDLEAVSERVRAALLINSSNNPEACARADGVAYGGDASWQGLVLAGSRIRISAAIEALARVPAVPAELEEREPDLQLEDLRAAMMLTALVLRAFERHALLDDLGPGNEGEHRE